jgi:hypothetical protein
MKRKMTVAALGLTVLMAGCGKLSGAASQTPASSAGGQGSVVPIKAFTVGADQNGKYLIIHIGQELIVQLGPSFAMSQISTPNVTYTASFLGFTNKGAPFGTYVFVGRTLGLGSISIANPSCQPGPAMGPPAGDAGAQCAAVGPAQGSSSADSGASSGLRLFTATVRVMPIGA